MFDHPLFALGLPWHPWAGSAIALSLGTALAWVILRFSHSAQRSARGVTSALTWGRMPLVLGLGLALVAALLSALYFDDFLRGGPRIIDATAYLLEARTLLTGSFTFQPPVPSDLFVGRFLLRSLEDPSRVGVLFPPGYPAWLALFEAVASYRLAGPCVAALLALATYQLTLSLLSREQNGRTSSELELGARRLTALAAAALSALSMTLRYHSAEPMSHGLSTLLVALSCNLVLGGRGSRSWPRALGLGLCLGWLFATRPLTALAVGLALVCFEGTLPRFVAALARGPRALVAAGAECGHLDGRALLALAAGAIPGVLLYGLYQRALTGSFLGSAQLAYYLRSDGPGACFGLGFGKGCLYEHADVIQARGFLGPLWAVLNSLHRLHQHCLDIANFEPIALGLGVYLWRARRRDFARLTLLVLGFLVVAYSFFYFDGSFPGGGARFLVEVLPLEHACLAIVARRAGLTLLLFSASLFGFACHGVHSHLALRDRDGGAPFVRDSLVRSASRQVVFVRSDHAFLAGYDPRRLPYERASSGPLFARRSFDSREELLLTGLGLDAAWTLEREPPGASLSPWTRSVSPSARVFEAESAWPPVEIRGAWGHPGHVSSACVPSGRGLVLYRDPARSGPAQLVLWLDVPVPRDAVIEAHFFRPSDGCFRKQLASPVSRSLIIPLEEVLEGAGEASADDVLALRRGGLVLDRYEIRPR